ncbi:MAG TPA: SMC family ATPase [Thermomicrobiales bacterium]|nr:SMC family ATPase [Thermomicrobiales bacterium]
MILAAMTIENFKQFTGTHEIVFPSTGIVGIIGPNGVGKTTLFEAIEWCLYNPRTIQNPDVVPRGTAARTRVSVTLEDPREGVRYVIARSLRGGKTSSAEIFREDEPENRITQGPGEVTRYVTSRLVGLSHSAFVSTFFTRQKELTFFGNVSPTERRVAVAKLLGYETIRNAQEQLGRERSQAKHAADALRSQHAEQTDGRDFASEMATADAAVVLHERQVVAAQACSNQAAATLRDASQEAERWRDLERHHAVLTMELGRIDGNIRAIEARRDNAHSMLANLDAAAAKRAELVPVAVRVEERERMLAEQEEARSRHERAQRLNEALQRAQDGCDRAARAGKQTVAAADAGAIDGWVWRAADALDPVAATVRLQEVADGLDLDSARAHMATLDRLRTLAEVRDQNVARHTRCQQTLDALRAEITQIVADGDPERAAVAARENREQALVAATSAASEAKGLAAARTRLERIVTTLRQTTFDEAANVCPTCQRSFSADEAEITILTLGQRIAESRHEEAEAKRREHGARAAADAAGRDQSIAEERLQRLSEARGRWERGIEVTRESEENANVAIEALEAALHQAGRAALPSPDEMHAAHDHLACLERVVRAAATLRQIESEARQHAKDAATARAESASLGETRYDEAEHQAARQAVTAAREAVTRIQEIEQQLARRPEIEAALKAAEHDQTSAEGQRSALVKQREVTGFSVEGLQAAIQAEATARVTERSALDHHAEARAAHMDALNHRTALSQEHQRIADLAQRADALMRECETLNQIYDEFTAFDRYVANRVTPYLAEQTAELLATITDSRYDQVHFDKDYGLRVYDGPVDSFPIGTFSGGERDAVALCARLALSRVVGAQAANPPSFLVLDEVFGALDRDRRTHVLHTLGALAGTAEAYRQLFIISHVDDIRQSSIFDEVWRVSAGPEGSYVERIDQDGALEEA